MIQLDVTHLIVAAAALLAPPLLRRLQAPTAPAPAAPPAVPTLPPEVAALLPLHGAVLNLALKLLQQPAPQAAPLPAAK